MIEVKTAIYGYDRRRMRIIHGSRKNGQTDSLNRDDGSNHTEDQSGKECGKNNYGSKRR